MNAFTQDELHMRDVAVPNKNNDMHAIINDVIEAVDPLALDYRRGQLPQYISS